MNKATLQDSEFKIEGSGFRIQNSGFRIQFVEGPFFSLALKTGKKTGTPHPSQFQFLTKIWQL